MCHGLPVQTMLFYNRKRSFMSAASGSGNDKQDINGIVQVGANWGGAAGGGRRAGVPERSRGRAAKAGGQCAVRS